MVFPASDLSLENVLRDVHDQANQQLRVNAIVNIDDITVDVGDIIIRDATNPADKLKVNADGSIDTNTIISQVDDSIRIGDGVNLITSTTVGSKQGLDVNIAAGKVSIEGLSTNIKTTVITVTDTPTAVPLTALANRNAISIRVWGEKIVYFGDSSVDSTTGYPKFQYEEIVMDIKDSPAITLYAVCSTGESSEIRILELA